MTFVVLNFAAKLQQCHELRNKNKLMISFRGGIWLIINLLSSAIDNIVKEWILFVICQILQKAT